MERGSNTTTTLDRKLQEAELVENKTIAKLEDGTPIKVGDFVFFHGEYNGIWNGGEIIVTEASAIDKEAYLISGTEWDITELEWAIAEGRIRSHHIFNLSRQNPFTNHEISYIKSSI